MDAAKYIFDLTFYQLIILALEGAVVEVVRKNREEVSQPVHVVKRILDQLGFFLQHNFKQWVIFHNLHQPVESEENVETE